MGRQRQAPWTLRVTTPKGQFDVAMISQDLGAASAEMLAVAAEWCQILAPETLVAATWSCAPAESPAETAATS